MNGDPIGYQTDLGGEQGVGHPGVDLVPLDYALESKRDGYKPSDSHRDLYAPVSGTIHKRAGEHRIVIETAVQEGKVYVELVHVSPSEGPSDGSTVQAGMPLNMTFKGRGYGEGSEYPHLHIGIYTGSEENRTYQKPNLPPVSGAGGNLGNYWTYIDPADQLNFTQLPYEK